MATHHARAHLKALVLNCKNKLRLSAPAVQLLKSSVARVWPRIHILSASPVYLPTLMLSLQC